MSVYDELADVLNGFVRAAVGADDGRASSVQEWKVAKVSPLTLEEMAGDLVLEEGDPDFSIATTLTDVDVGDTVLVVEAAGQFFATVVVR